MTDPSGTQRRPAFASVTKLVARSLGIAPAELLRAFRPAESRDLAALLALRRHQLGTEPGWQDDAYLRWRYGLAEGGQKTPAKCFVLEIGGELIGCVGVEEFQVAWRKGRLASGCPMDLAIHPEFRTIGLGPWMSLALFERYSTLLAMGANANSRGLIRGLFATLRDREVYQFPVNVRAFLARRLRSRLLSYIISPFVNVALRIAKRPARSNLEVVEVETFDASVDALIDAAATNGNVTPVRTRGHLNWRYFTNPRRRYHVIAAKRAGAWLGYLVYREGTDVSGTPTLHLADWVVLPSVLKEVFERLIAETITRARSGHRAYLSAGTSDAAVQTLFLNMGFWRRSSSGTVTSIHANDSALERSLSEATDWSVTEFGDDADGF